jgi:hypothetical protein
MKGGRPTFAFRGKLSLPNASHNLWIAYFSEPTPDSLSSLRNDSPLASHLADFNFTDIKPRAITSKSKAILENPDGALTSILGLERPIASAYFKFCRLLLEQNLSLDAFQALASQVCIRLSRALIAFSVQFQRDFQKLSEGVESPEFPLQFFDDIPALVEVVLLTESAVPDNVILLQPIIDLYLRMIDSETPLWTSLFGVFLAVLKFIQEQRSDAPEISSLYSFAIRIFESFDRFDDLFALFCSYIAHEADFAMQFFTHDCYLHFLLNIGKVLNRIVSNQPNQAGFAIGVEMLKCINVPTTVRVEFPVMRETFAFLEWSVQLVSGKIIEEPEIEVENVSLNQTLSQLLSEFIEAELFDRAVLKEPPAPFVHPADVFWQTCHFLKRVVPILSQFCQNTEKGLELFVNAFLARPALFNRYLVVKILSLCQSSKVAAVIGQLNCWEQFIDSSVFNAQTLLDIGNPLLLNLKDLLMLLIHETVNSADGVLILNALGQLLSVQQPVVAFRLFQTLRSLFSDLMRANFSESPILDFGLKISDASRVADATDAQKKARSAILAFLFQFAESADALDFIFSNDRRTAFVYSMLFEKLTIELAIELIFRGLKGAKSSLACKVMDLLLKVGLENATKGEQWLNLIWAMSDCIGAAIAMSPETVVVNVLRTNLLETFSKVPAGLMSTGDKSLVLRFVHRTIEFFTKLGTYSREIRNSLTTSSWSFVNNMRAPLLYCDLTKLSVRLLVKFAEYRGHLAIPEGVELLFLATAKSDLRESILDYLVQMTSTSVANRYQCFRANVLDGLLKLIADTPSPTAFLLFSQLGSSFFRISELALTLRLIAQSETPVALTLVKSILRMMKMVKADAPKSFFSLYDRETFRIQSLLVPATFSIQMRVSFFASDADARVFLTLANRTQRLELVLDTTKLVAAVSDGKHKHQFRLASGIEQDCWYDLKLSCTPTVISLLVNDEVQTSSVIPTRFRFEEPASLELGHFFWAVAWFRVDGLASQFKAHFDAKCVTNMKCYNTISGTSISHADYDGLPVVQSQSFVDAVAASGGALVLLPVFDVVMRSATPARFLKMLLKLVLRIVAQAQQLFAGDGFFRSLGFLLGKLDVAVVTAECIELLYDMYKVSGGRAEMLQSIFARFSLWNGMDTARQSFVFSAIFPGLLEADPGTFVRTVSFGDLLVEFSRLAPDLTQRCWKFQRVVSSVRMVRRDAELLLGSAMRLVPEELCCRSLDLVMQLVADGCPAMHGVLQELEVFPPLLAMLNSGSERVRLTAVSALAFAQAVLALETFGAAMIDSVRVWTVQDGTASTRNSIMNAMTLCISVDSFALLPTTFDYNEVKPLLRPQFLPLLCTVVQFAHASACACVCTYLRASIAAFPESRGLFDACPHWVFWLLFLAICDGCVAEWLECIRLIACESSAIVRIIGQLRCLGAAMHLETSGVALALFSAAFNARPTPELADCIVRNLLWQIDCHAATDPFENSVHLCIQRIVTMDQIHVSACFRERASDDLACRLTTAVAAFLLSQSTKFLSEQSAVINCSNFTLLCYLVRRVSNPDVARALVPRARDFEHSDALMIEDEAVADFEAALVAAIPAISAAFRAEIDALSTEIRRSLMRIFEDKNIALANPSQLFEIEQCRLDANRARDSRVAAKFWRSMMKRLACHHDGPWAQIACHFKFDTVADASWRRNKMRINRTFDNHADAAFLRDSGTDIERKTVRRTNDVVDVPDGHSLELDCLLVSTRWNFSGTLYLSSAAIAFEAKHVTDTVGDLIEKAAKLIEINLDSIAFVLKRRYLHVDCACKVFTQLRSSRFFVFGNAAARDEFFKKLRALNPNRLRFIQTGDAAQTYNELKLFARWSSGSLSNYEYLYWLNLLSGRSLHDLSQYPVFPWVIADYNTQKLDFDSPETYRDLSLPIGAMNPERITQLRFLFTETMEEPFACLYRFHYSAPAYVIGYLLRAERFTSLHIQLQGGRFDIANRLFFSIRDAWQSLCSLQNDFRELIPEFYAPGVPPQCEWLRSGPALILAGWQRRPDADQRRGRRASSVGAVCVCVCCAESDCARVCICVIASA